LRPGTAGYLDAVLDDHPRLAVGDRERVDVDEDLLEGGPVGARLARIPVVAVRSDEVDVAVTRVVRVRIAARARVEGPRHHRPHERDVVDSAAAEDVHDAAERVGVLRRGPEP
jgi:hypothetical protein